MKRLGALAISITWAAALAHGAPIYGTSAITELIGFRAENSGVVVGGQYETDGVISVIAWEISSLPGRSWSYLYTLTGFRSPAISHFILDLTDDCVPGNPGCVTEANGVLEFNAFSQAPSNPGFPVGAEIKGVKFDFGSESPAIYSFMSNRAPVYGDFYSKGGNASFAYNAGLVNHGSGSITDFVVRPDGTIPEPASISLIALGLILGVTARLRRLSGSTNRSHS